MVFFEEDKAFIKILHLIYVGSGLHRLMRDFPDKGWKKSGVDNLITKPLKQWMSNRNQGSDNRELCQLASDVIGLKLLCWWLVDILNTKGNAKFDTTYQQH